MFADLMRLLLADSRPAALSISAEDGAALWAFAVPFSSSRYSDSRLLTDVAVFSYKNKI